MTVSTDHNISVQGYNKISKCKDLEIEIEKMWRLKATTTVAIIAETQSMIEKRTDKYLMTIPDNHSHMKCKNCTF